MVQHAIDQRYLVFPNDLLSQGLSQRISGYINQICIHVRGDSKELVES